MPDNLAHLPLPPPEPEPHVVVGGRDSERRLPQRDQKAHAQQLRAQVVGLEEELARLGAEVRPDSSQGFLYSATFADETDPRVGSLSNKPAGSAVVDYNPLENRALVYTPRPKLGDLRSKIRQYADPEKVSETTGLPRNAALLAPLESL